MARKPILTTTAGIPVADNQNSVTAGARGPVLLQVYQLIEKLAHQNRERIPERVVHAKRWGAHGTFTVTNDITRFTYTQPGNLFRLMPPDAQARLMDNIRDAMQGVPLEIVRRQIAHFYRADPDYGIGVATRMGLSAGDLPWAQAAE